MANSQRPSSGSIADLAVLKLNVHALEQNVRSLEEKSAAHFDTDEEQFRVINARTRRLARAVGRPSDSTRSRKATGISLLVEQLWSAHVEEQSERAVFRKRLLIVGSILTTIMTAVLGAVISLVVSKYAGKS
jgi:hypothetical protein